MSLLPRAALRRDWEQPCMSSRHMSLLPRAALRSGSEHFQMQF
jgi:hypothetical protein